MPAHHGEDPAAAPAASAGWRSGTNRSLGGRVGTGGKVRGATFVRVMTGSLFPLPACPGRRRRGPPSFPGGDVSQARRRWAFLSVAPVLAPTACPPLRRARPSLMPVGAAGALPPSAIHRRTRPGRPGPHGSVFTPRLLDRDDPGPGLPANWRRIRSAASAPPSSSRTIRSSAPHDQHLELPVVGVGQGAPAGCPRTPSPRPATKQPAPPPATVFQRLLSRSTGGSPSTFPGPWTRNRCHPAQAPPPAKPDPVGSDGKLRPSWSAYYSRTAATDVADGGPADARPNPHTDARVARKPGAGSQVRVSPGNPERPARRARRPLSNVTPSGSAVIPGLGPL